MFFINLKNITINIHLIEENVLLINALTKYTTTDKGKIMRIL